MNNREKYMTAAVMTDDKVASYVTAGKSPDPQFNTLLTGEYAFAKHVARLKVAYQSCPQFCLEESCDSCVAALRQNQFGIACQPVEINGKKVGWMNQDFIGIKKSRLKGWELDYERNGGFDGFTFIGEFPDKLEEPDLCFLKKWMEEGKARNSSHIHISTSADYISSHRRDYAFHIDIRRPSSARFAEVLSEKFGGASEIYKPLVEACSANPELIAAAIDDRAMRLRLTSSAEALDGYLPSMGSDVRLIGNNF